MSAQLIQILETSFFTDDILCLRLKANTPIEFHAGQYILLGLDPEELKPFSIAAAPDGSGEIECHIRKNRQSPWMQALFTKQSGDTLYWQGPINHVSLAKNNSLPTIFVAGGTGFALVKALLETQLADQLSHPIHIYWGVRQAVDLYQHNWLVQLCQQHSNIDYTPVISEQEHNWHGTTGSVHKKVLQDFASLAEHLVYLCGPPDMQKAAKPAFLAAGLNEKNFIS
ncbi:NAD(P)H-flavin reductase [Thiomicrorhabdus indica]|uniref:NAD(P)H-flavin reductase n=1 Tax=Thiomicrorhabdus indica TaxID=2267253 RepID=UPI00102DDC0D|nr:NAD(P)H-flavin reductase [Thiomicrorhabdus indica]